MTPYTRIAMLSAALIAAIMLAWPILFGGGSFAMWASDYFDSRPTRRILFVGNSRTSYYNMPQMVRHIADSAGSPERYHVRMHAPGGVRLEGHWNNNALHALLAEGWNDVILQGQSGEQLNEASEASFQTHGEKLVEAARKAGARPVLYLSWRYSPDFPSDLYRDYPYYITRLHGMMQQSYAQLARRSGAQIVNVGKAWEALLATNPPFALYDDDTHQSLHGSYLVALMMYRHLSQQSLEAVRYIPDGISEAEATILRAAAGR